MTGSTPSPKRLPISTCEGEKITSPPDIATSSPALSKGRTNEDTTDSSMLDLTDTKYRDFEVSLDSSFCLPSTRTSIIRRPPTPPPPRTKRKSVTFAAPLEKVVEEPVGTQAALPETVVPTIMDQWDELEYLELAPELARASRVDSFHCLGKHLTIEPQPTHLSQHPASLTAKPLSLLSSPLALRQNGPYPTEAPPSAAARGKQKHRARDTSPSPSTRAESTTLGSYLIPIMAVGPLCVAVYRAFDASSQVLDEIHAVIKSNIQTRFESFNGHVVELRRQILAQTQADLTALLDE